MKIPGFKVDAGEVARGAAVPALSAAALRLAESKAAILFPAITPKIAPLKRFLAWKDLISSLMVASSTSGA